MKTIIIQGGRLEEKRSNPNEPMYMDLMLTGENIRVFNVESKGAVPQEIGADQGKCIIWSIEHNAWWKAGENGYTQSREEAGVYSIERAREILKGANIGEKDTPNEAIIFV